MPKSLQSCLKYLSNSGFITLSQTCAKSRVNEFSTYGLLVRRNINQSLFRFLQTLNVFPTFPANSLSHIAQIRNEIIPKSVKTFGIYFSSPEPLVDESQQCESELTNIWENQRPALNLLVFCEENVSSNLYYSFQNYSYRWWRKLSPAPSCFHQSAIQQGSNEGNNAMQITFCSPFTDGLPVCVERMQQITKRDRVEKLYGTEECKEIIHCTIFPDNSTFSYLVNGLVSHPDNGVIKEITFKETLAPYKVALSLQSSGNATDLRMKEVANYLLRDLGSRGIDVFPFIYRSPENVLESFSGLDEIGVPYVVSIKPDSVNTGIVYLRNKETKLMEEVHISQLKITLLLYLKMTSPLEVKSAILEDAIKSKITVD